jgi:pimeloyl-ACP methyl ester carboxylesterase
MTQRAPSTHTGDAPLPVPPIPLPPARIVLVPGRGEFFLRDSGGSGTPVLLIHGWMFPSDLNWLHAYAPLQRAGYRVLAMDLRGHGRGLRADAPFRLADCADDAAALLDTLGVAPALVAGYSMGGLVTQLLARRHPDRVAGFVLCATAKDWSDLRLRVIWRTMSGLRLLLGLFPRGAWRTGMRLAGAGSRESSWVTGELSRGSARDLAEAGREMGRFDSTSWLGELSQPRSVVVMTRDRLVLPRKQRALAKALGVAPVLVDGRPRRLLHDAEPLPRRAAAGAGTGHRVGAADRLDRVSRSGPSPARSGSTRCRKPAHVEVLGQVGRCWSQATQVFSRSGACTLGLFQTRTCRASARQPLAEHCTASSCSMPASVGGRPARTRVYRLAAWTGSGAASSCSGRRRSTGSAPGRGGHCAGRRRREPRRRARPADGRREPTWWSAPTSRSGPGTARP